MRFALSALTVFVLAQQPARDAFVEHRDAAAALNPASPRFTIAFPDGRRAFRVGERIPIVFTYDNVWNRSVLDEQSYTHFARPVVDRIEGTGRPHEDFERAGVYVPRGVCGCVEGGVVAPAPSLVSPPPVFGGLDPDGRPIIVYPPSFMPPPAPLPQHPPVVRRYVLNNGLRFDAAGSYRLYMEDFHDREQRLDSPPVISNLIDIEITPRDGAADDRVVRDARSVLDNATDPVERREAARALGYTGSPLAIKEMAQRLYPNREIREEDYYLAAGLFGVPNRALAIASMEARIDDPSSQITAYYSKALAALQLVARTTGRPSSTAKVEAMQAVELRRLRALARAGRLEDDLLSTFQGHFRVEITPALASYAASVRAALNRLSPSARRAALDEHRNALARAGVASRTGSTEKDVVDPREEVAGTAKDATIYARLREDGEWVYVVGDGPLVSSERLDSQLLRYPRGTMFKWSDDLDYSLQSWYINTDLQLARVAAILARRGMRVVRR